MGRYLRGTEGFTYKYVVARQAANLDLLAGTAGCGRGGMEPLLSASMKSRDETLDVPVVELLREIVLRTGSAKDFVKVLYRGNVVPSHLGEDVGFATGQAIVGLITLLDERLPAVAERVTLCARGSYEIERAEYPALLAYVNCHLPAGDQLRLESPLSETALEAAAEKLGDADDHLPLLALCILNHATAHRLDHIAVSEDMPEIELGPSGRAALWPVIRTSWGPDEIRADALPEGTDALFARGLIEYWSGEGEAATAALRRSHERGDARARRWLSALGVEVAPLPQPRPAREHIRDAAALEAALDLREELEDSEDARRELAEAHASRDAERLTTLLARWRSGATLDHELAGDALNVILLHRDPFLIARAFGAVSKLVDPATRLGAHLAYNLACAAAVLGFKKEMLAWLRSARLAGDHPRDALEDGDFANFHDDPDLRALADEP